MDRTGTGLASLVNGSCQAHLVGLDGKDMAGLARMLVERGVVVTGSIQEPTPATDRLRRLGVRVHAGHSPRHVPRSAHLLIYSPDISRDHPDRLSAARVGVEQQSTSKVMADLLRRGLGIATSGGRQAAIASAMIGWILTHAGLDPTIILDSNPVQRIDRTQSGRGPHVIIETENCFPTDHLSGVPIVLIHDEWNPSARSEVLRRWVDCSPPGGYVLGFADEKDEVIDQTTEIVEVERFSLSPGHAWWGADVRQDRGCYRFRAFHRGRFAMEVRLQVPGRHLVLGALAAVAVCGRVDLNCRAIKEALEEFGGISRGFESRGSFRGVTLVDDEAEGVQGVSDALAVAREVFGARRLCVAYRSPAGVNPTWPIAEDFAEADRVWIIDGDDPADSWKVEQLARTLRDRGVEVGRALGLEEAIRELDRDLEPGDVLVTLGAGDVGTIADAFLRRLSDDRHG